MISRKSIYAVLVSTVLMTACGGGGNDQVNEGHEPGTPLPADTQLYGIAATGSAMQNAIVHIKDKAGAIRTITANIDGTFLLDVTGMTFPAMVRASSFDGEVTVYGFVFESNIGEQIAVTPISSLVVTDALNVNPASAYETFGGAASADLDSAVATAAEGIYNALSPIMTELGVSLTVGELYAGFVADHTGVDRVMDSIVVEITGTTATIKDKFGTTVANADLAAVDSFVVTLSDGLVEGADAAASVTMALNEFNAHCYTLPITEDCTSLFPGAFKHAGVTDPYTWATWHQEEAEEVPVSPSLITYRLLGIDGKDEIGYKASYSINIFANGVTRTEKDQGYFKGNEAGDIVFYGDGENMWLDFTLDEANNALYVKARTKVAPLNFQYALIAGAGVPPSVKAKIVAGRWPDGFGNYVSQVCLRLMSQIDNPSSSCNTGQYYDDITYPLGKYIGLTYQAYDNNDTAITAYSGKQWLKFQ